MPAIVSDPLRTAFCLCLVTKSRIDLYQQVPSMGGRASLLPAPTSISPASMDAPYTISPDTCGEFPYRIILPRWQSITSSRSPGSVGGLLGFNPARFKAAGSFTKKSSATTRLISFHDEPENTNSRAGGRVSFCPTVTLEYVYRPENTALIRVIASPTTSWPDEMPRGPQKAAVSMNTVRTVVSPVTSVVIARRQHLDLRRA